MGRAILGMGAWGWRGRGGREGEVEWVYSKGDCFQLTGRIVGPASLFATFGEAMA